MLNFRLNLRNVATIVACLAVCAVVSCGGKDKDGKEPEGIDITLSIKAGVNENEVIIVCSPAMPKEFMDMGGFPPFYFVEGYGVDTYTPFRYNKTGGTGNIHFYMYESEWNAAGSEYTCTFETFGTGTWEGTVSLNPIGSLVEGTGWFGLKSLKIGTNTPVTVKIQ